MPTAYKVLGQVAPTATTETTAYTVPAATESVISTIIIANRGGSAGTYRLSIRPDGATLSDEHYIAYDVAVSSNDSTTLTLGITMDAGDVLSAYCSTADMSINVFGSEIT